LLKTPEFENLFSRGPGKLIKNSILLLLLKNSWNFIVTSKEHMKNADITFSTNVW